jgi:hypothetical protein
VNGFQVPADGKNRPPIDKIGGWLYGMPEVFYEVVQPARAIKEPPQFLALKLLNGQRKLNH